MRAPWTLIVLGLFACEPSTPDSGASKPTDPTIEAPEADTGDTGEDTGDTGEDTGETGDTADTADTGAPSVTITSPPDGTGGYGQIDLAFEVSNFELVTATFAPDTGDTAGDTAGDTGEPPVASGHVHILVDDAYVDYTSATTYTVTGLASGARTLTVALADEDHNLLGPSDSVDVAILNPTVAITSPADGDTVSTDVALALEITEFTMNAADVDGAPVFGEGHYHVLVDGVLHTEGTDAAGTTLTGLAPGSYSLQVELVHGGHGSLTPPVLSDAIDVHVNAAAR